MIPKFSSNRLNFNIVNVLFVAFFLLIFIAGAYNFGKELNKDIEYKKEIIKLEKEKLRLEIELKRLQIESSKMATNNK